MGFIQTYCTVCAGPFEIPDSEEVCEMMELKSLKMQNFQADLLHNLEWLLDPVGIDIQERHHDSFGYEDCYDGGLEKCNQMHSDSEHVNDSDESDSAYQFYSKSTADTDGAPYGLIIHKSCKQILKDYLDYEVKFADVFHKIRSYNYDIQDAISNLDHAEMQPYAQQLFEFAEMMSDNKAWLIQDPITNQQNRSRIINCWSPLVKGIQDARVDE